MQVLDLNLSQVTSYRDSGCPRPQHDHPATSVIAQQYYSSTYISLRSHYRKQNFGAIPRRYHFKSFYFCENSVKSEIP